MASVTAFIQARLSSSRFPGKVLVDFLGTPIIDRVVDTVRSVPSVQEVVVLTSEESSDDPLISHLAQRKCRFFRGPLVDVFRRFQLAAAKYPSDWILRLCADSPLLSPRVVAEVTREAETTDAHLVTTRFSPPFPKGQNAELIRTESLLAVDPAELTDHDREHVTPWFYRHPEWYRVAHARQVEFEYPRTDFAVDTPEDLERLIGLVKDHPAKSKQKMQS